MSNRQISQHNAGSRTVNSQKVATTQPKRLPSFTARDASSAPSMTPMAAKTYMPRARPQVAHWRTFGPFLEMHRPDFVIKCGKQKIMRNVTTPSKHVMAATALISSKNGHRNGCSSTALICMLALSTCDCLLVLVRLTFPSAVIDLLKGTGFTLDAVLLVRKVVHVLSWAM